MANELRLDPESATPVYAQIGEDVRRRIAGGDLRPGDRLLPVRTLARVLGINVNTVARAYIDLVHDGVVIARRGGGTVVSAGAADRLRAERAARLADLADGLLVRGLALGFSADEVEAALALQAARQRTHSHGELRTATAERPAGILSFVGSHDLSLDVLFQRLAHAQPPVRIEARYAGSLDGLVALVHGEADLAGCHLLDEETGAYNEPFIRRVLPGQPVRLITVARRAQGLLLPAGNPLGLENLADLARPGLRLANRQRGSGTRVLLDFLLRRSGIDATAIAGYECTHPTHLAVATAVAHGEADVGLGIQAAGAAYSLTFVPLMEEPYELVLPLAAQERPETQALLAAIRGPDFRRLVAAMGGYDVTSTGEERTVGNV